MDKYDKIEELEGTQEKIMKILIEIAKSLEVIARKS